MKGGTDHNLPILVSKVCRPNGQAENVSEDHLYINADEEEEVTGEPEATAGDTQTDVIEATEMTPPF